MHRPVILATAFLLLLVALPARAEFAIDTTVGIWVNAAELSQLPVTGAAWDDLLAEATAACATPNLPLIDDNADGCILAKAIAHLRLEVANPGDPQAATLRADVLGVLAQMMDEANWCENGACLPGVSLGTRSSLAVGRNLGAYITAAELIGLDDTDAPSKTDFLGFLEGTANPLDPEEIEAGVLNYEWIDDGTVALPLKRRTLRDTHDERPQNWGGHACATLAAAAIYRDNASELLQIRDVMLGWQGDCTTGDCSNFSYGVDAQDWTCDQQPPDSAVNEENACNVDLIVGPGVDHMDLAGVHVDDMRRAGDFPAGCDGYPRACVADSHIWDGLQGRTACAWILRRQGLDVFSASDEALYRAFQFQHRPIWLIGGVPGMAHPPYLDEDGGTNDDAYLTYIINHVYRESFPHDPAVGGPGFKDFGKGFGWTRYTLGENPCSFLFVDPDFDGICDDAALPAAPPGALGLGGAIFALCARVLLARGPRSTRRKR